MTSDLKDRLDCRRYHLMTVVQRQLSPRFQHVPSYLLPSPSYNTLNHHINRTNNPSDALYDD